MSSALAGRIDFEIARAREWCDDQFTPLVDVAAPTSDDGRPAVDLVVARAARVVAHSGTTPGAGATRLIGLFIPIIVALASAAGAQLAVTILGDPGIGPVNIIWLLVHALAVPTAFLLLSILLLLPITPGLGALRVGLGETLSLGSLVVNAAMRLANRTRDLRSDSGPRLTAFHRLRALAPLRFLAIATSHAGWTGFHVGFLAAAALVLSAQHHSFAWQSTFVNNAAEATAIIRTVTLPAGVWPGRPTTEQVRLSRYLPDERRFADDGSNPAYALALRQAWSRQLLATVAGFGLLPRVALLLLASILWLMSRRRLKPDPDDPYVVAVWTSLRPPLTTAAETAPPALTAAPVAKLATPTDTPHQPPSTWFVAPVLSAARGHESPCAAVWEQALSGWRDLPRLDGRSAEHKAFTAVAAATPRPIGVVLLCDYGATPDAAIARLATRLHEAAGSDGRLVVLLVGASEFRKTRIGNTPEGIERRRQVWLDATHRWALSAVTLIEFDLDAATPQARRGLADKLAIQLATGRDVGPDANRVAFHTALDDIDRAAPSWREQLATLPADQLEPAQLRLAASACRQIDAAFGIGDAFFVSDHGPTRAITACLAATLRSDELEQRVLATAARSVGGMWSILAGAKDLDPKFVIAGLTAGLVAGPLGGAIIAGTSGLLAGASLATTLATLGAATGGTLSVSLARLRVAGRGADLEPVIVDRLGLPARTAVTRIIVVANQGRSEVEISTRLSEVARHQTATDAIDSADAVRQLTTLARERAAP